MTANKTGPNDIFEFKRTEVELVVSYLANRPAKEVYNLLKILTERAPAQFTGVEELPVTDASANN